MSLKKGQVYLASSQQVFYPTGLGNTTSISPYGKYQIYPKNNLNWINRDNLSNYVYYLRREPSNSNTFNVDHWILGFDEMSEEFLLLYSGESNGSTSNTLETIAVGINTEGNKDIYFPTGWTNSLYASEFEMLVNDSLYQFKIFEDGEANLNYKITGGIDVIPHNVIYEFADYGLKYPDQGGWEIQIESEESDFLYYFSTEENPKSIPYMETAFDSNFNVSRYEITGILNKLEISHDNELYFFIKKGSYHNESESFSSREYDIAVLEAPSQPPPFIPPSNTPTPTKTPTNTPTPSITTTKTVTPTPTTTPNKSPTPTATPTSTPDKSPTPTATVTVTSTISPTPTITPSETSAPSESSKYIDFEIEKFEQDILPPSPTPTSTSTTTPFKSPTPTSTITPTTTVTPTNSLDASATPTPTVTNSVTVTPTLTTTPTVTPTATITATNSPTVTPTATSSITATPTLTPTISATPTVTPTISVTPSINPYDISYGNLIGDAHPTLGNSIVIGTGDFYGAYYDDEFFPDDSTYIVTTDPSLGLEGFTYTSGGGGHLWKLTANENTLGQTFVPILLSSNQDFSNNLLPEFSISNKQFTSNKLDSFDLEGDQSQIDLSYTGLHKLTLYNSTSNSLLDSLTGVFLWDFESFKSNKPNYFQGGAEIYWDSNNPAAWKVTDGGSQTETISTSESWLDIDTINADIKVKDEEKIRIPQSYENSFPAPTPTTTPTNTPTTTPTATPTPSTSPAQTFEQNDEIIFGSGGEDLTQGQHVTTAFVGFITQVNTSDYDVTYFDSNGDTASTTLSENQMMHTTKYSNSAFNDLALGACSFSIDGTATYSSSTVTIKGITTVCQYHIQHSTNTFLYELFVPESQLS